MREPESDRLPLGGGIIVAFPLLLCGLFLFLTVFMVNMHYSAVRQTLNAILKNVSMTPEASPLCTCSGPLTLFSAASFEQCPHVKTTPGTLRGLFGLRVEFKSRHSHLQPV